ncbi:MAG: sigma-70 family RNA polymerase sigma factor [Chitinophagaceae bacterium]|nr:sigma-70 family RNA polymerase sigma factor [Chitinophagaceae bacterium]
MAIDSNIWAKVSRGNKEAYGELYRYMYKRLYNYGAKFTEEYVILEDVIQETLLLVWNDRSVIGTLTYAETYFYSVFRNILLQRLKEHYIQTRKITETTEPEFNVEQVIIKNEHDLELKKRLEDSVKGLTSRQREVIYLRFYEGFSYEKVGSVLGITTKATYKIVARALERLKEIMLISLIILL